MSLPERRLIGRMGVAAVLLASGCARPILAPDLDIERGADHDENVEHVRFQGLGAELRRVPIRRLSRRPGAFGFQVTVAELAGNDDLMRRYGVFSGVEGAPLIDAKGALVGAVVGSIGDLDCRLCSIVERGAIDRLWTAGRYCLELDAPALGAAATSSREVAAGTAIAVVPYWSDEPTLECDYGTITEVRGDQAVLMTLASLRGLASPDHRERLAIVGVETVAIGGMTNRYARVVRRGPVVGTAIYRGTLGYFGVLGRKPESIRVEVALERTSRRVATHRAEVVVDRGDTGAHVTAYVGACLRLEGASRPGRAEVAIVGGDAAATVREVAASGPQSLVDAIPAAIAPLVAACEAARERHLRVHVRLQEVR